MVFDSITPGNFSVVEEEANLEKKFDNNGAENVNGINTIFDLEKNLINSINNFYTKYAQYVRCKGETPVTDNYGITRYNNSIRNNITSSNRCTTTTTESDVNEAFADVKKKADALRDASNSLGNTGGISKTTYNTNLSNIIDKNSKNVALRGDLDLKLKELFQAEDSKFKESKLLYDSTMYTGIAWTILATSCLYYIFTNL
jgi:hypothetical protein